MTELADRLMQSVLIGIGATLLLDFWTVVLRLGFGIQSLDYCLLGRWIAHLRSGTIAHSSIEAAAKRPHECTIGWTTHYGIGIAFACIFLFIAPATWLSHPTLPRALAFGVLTVVVPFVTMQPALGMGVAASRTKHPWNARLKSVGTHAVFGVGLYLSAAVLHLINPHITP